MGCSVDSFLSNGSNLAPDILQVETASPTARGYCYANILTANCAMILVRSVSTAVASRTDDGRGTTPSIAAPQGTIESLSVRFVTKESHKEGGHRPGTAQVRWFITAIATGDYRIAEFVLWETLPTSALEGVVWTATRFDCCGIATDLILSMRTLSLSIADPSPGDAPPTLGAFEGLLGTLRRCF